MLFGQCGKGHVCRNRSFCEFLILGEVRLVTEDFTSESFLDEDNGPTYSLEIIRLKCTPPYQPCDVYFYRQVKNYSAVFQNCLVLIAANCEVIM